MLELINNPGSLPSPNAGGAEKTWMLRLYVAGQTLKSLVALANLRKICEQHVPNRYTIEIIDLLEHPQLAKSAQIIAIPTLVRDLPTPMRKIIGDLSNTTRVLIGLDITPLMGDVLHVD